MSLDVGPQPTAHVAELIRVVVKALRAFQMYLPNNPMYQRAEESLREAFAPVWEVTDEVALLVDETRLLWDEEVVYDQPHKAESFAWALYKDGLRLLVLRRGVEREEITRLLTAVSRARLMAADASDDLLTLLWQEEFTHVDYRFAEVVSDPWVYDPQALVLEPGAATDADEVREAVRAEVARELARPEGLVDPEEFDSTLYFLDEIEIAALAHQVEEEYHRDVRGAALDALFDVFELQRDPAVRAEVLDILELLFPNFLARGDFRVVAQVLREVRRLASSLADLDPAAKRRAEGYDERLSQPATIAQLLQALDEAEFLPAAEDLGEVLRELRAPALGEILRRLPTLSNPAVRNVVTAAAERLGSRNGDELVRLLGVLPAEALPWAMELAARLGLSKAIPQLGELVRGLGAEGRLAAVRALAALGTPSAMAALVPALEDEERAVRAAALAAMVQRSYAGALPRLEAAVTGESRFGFEPAELRHLFEAFATLAGPRAYEVLRGVALPQGLFRRRAPTDARTCAVYALGKLRTAEARLLVEQLATDKELPVRHAAGTVLREWA